MGWDIRFNLLVGLAYRQVKFTIENNRRDKKVYGLPGQGGSQYVFRRRVGFCGQVEYA